MPLKMAILLLSVYTLIDKCLLHLPPIQVTDLTTYWSQAPVNGYSYQRGGKMCAPLLFFMVIDEPTLCQFPL